ncbi:type II secretion system major pseudopilin GspG [Caminibacter pacificus]|jgi:general secretion pathway protein G|uniref:Type II secretion system core protein G n=1 Tax=Caminibacter pacificus TaxID=1424653 RepID=A0AAJ4UX90_9BACT|nr:type II secretion system major pseudopilin GspG [Caminibacter pacificus]NPA87518.1 type II secretion system major pseudopilin GspG [Campylobacterota bacterium]QCI27416.1 type II secretion system protein GspG [Caminibacter pacificus]ROR38853.1 type II secretion system protein G (GspG) [Caminibacter pacificus]
MKKAFSLIELMIVIIILGLIAGLVIPNIIGQGEQAKEKLVCVQMKNLKNALDSFKIQEGTYPTTQEGLKALIQNPNPQKYKNYPEGGFLNSNKLPRDPWGHPYIYVNNGGKIDIISLGADGKEGGSGENKDIRLSECQQ